MSGMRRFLQGAGVAAALLLPAAVPARADGLPDVIRLGMLTDMGGAYKANSGPGDLVAARMAVEDFGGTVAGHKIEVIGADEQNKPDAASSIAREWFDRGGVSAIFDGGNSVTANAILSVAASHDRAFLINGPASLAFTNESCTPVSIQFIYDAYALANATVKPLVGGGDTKWFFITADYAGGISLETGMADAVRRAGGTVTGSVRHPFPNADFSSFLLTAKMSGAQVVATANGGDDTINTIKQAAEFGLGPASGQRIAVSNLYINGILALGLPTAQGLVTSTPFYWDTDDATRAFAARYRAVTGVAPEMNHAGIYSAVLHYLKAVRDTGTVDGAAVVARMKQLPMEDFWNHGTVIRADGRVLNDMRLMQVKTPAESTGRDDVLKLLALVPGRDAFQPLAQGSCKLVAPGVSK